MPEAWTKTNEFKERKKWKPFHATDFDSLIYPCFFMCSIIGNFRYKRVSSGYSFSRIRFIFFMCVLTVNMSMVLFVEYRLIMDIDTIPKAIHQHFHFSVIVISILLTFVQNRAMLRLLQAMTNVSSMLAPKDFNDLAKFIHTKDIGIFLFVISHLPNCIASELILTLKNFTFISSVLNIVTMEMFYINCACVLKACFSKVNEDIQQLKKPVTQKFLRNGQSTPSLLMKLKNFEEKHLLISDVLQMLNKTFLIRMTVITCNAFVSVTFNIYFFILRINGGETGSKHVNFWYVPYICSAIFHFFNFAMIIWACETATSRAVQIRITLFDVLGEVSDMTMKREVEIFSLQLLHHENTFSAKLIKLNGSLLTQMVGGITLYILILIQFLLNTVICMFKNMET